MTEQYSENQMREVDVNTIYKYTSIKEIFNVIVGKGAASLSVSNNARKETQIIVVSSACGGVGKTTIALGISACLNKNYKRVLYINASRLQSFQALLSNVTQITTSDVYAKCYLQPTTFTRILSTQYETKGSVIFHLLGQH